MIFFPNTMFSRDIWYRTSKTLRNGYNVRGPFFLLHYYQWRFCIIESILIKSQKHGQSWCLRICTESIYLIPLINAVSLSVIPHVPTGPWLQPGLETSQRPFIPLSSCSNIPLNCSISGNSHHQGSLLVCMNYPED